jgi:hypothetical protein
MANQTQELINKSVTSRDYNEVNVKDGIVKFMVPFWNYFNQASIKMPPEPPPYWSLERDITLRASIHNEAMWAAAVGIAITKMASKAFEVKSSSALKARRGQELLLQADGRRVGWVGFLSKQLQDYFCTDNGSFCEIVRQSSGLNSPIIGLKHLDSLRCLRTGDPQNPVIFRDRYGNFHMLRDHQVICLSDMPDPGETWYGVGKCAATRAYYSIVKLASIEWYLREKVGGLHPLAIYIVNGMTTQQINSAVQTVEEDKVSKGVMAYMGAVVIGVPKDAPPELVKIPLAELPDRFDRKQEFDISVLNYADALGIDIQDLQPLTGQPLGTGAQSQVLDDKQKGKGSAAWEQDWTHALNEYVLDDMTTFMFVEKDYRDQAQRAAIMKQHADTATERANAGITSPAQELQWLVTQDDLPKEFLPSDQVPSEEVSDTEKPEQMDAEQSGTDASNPSSQAVAKPGAGKAPGSSGGTGTPAAPAAGGGNKLPFGKKSKESQGDTSQSVIAALFMPPAIARKIAVPDGNSPADLHITLADLGDNGTETADRQKIAEICRQVAQATPPISGVINGRGAFEKGDTRAHFLTLDAPDLPAFRQRLVDALKENQVQVIENHGFVPHITLTYNHEDDSPDVTLPKGEITIPALTLAWGDERETFPFHADHAHKELKPPSDQSLQEASQRLAQALRKAQKKNKKGLFNGILRLGYSKKRLSRKQPPKRQ